MKIMIVIDKLVGGGAERVATVWANTFVKFNHEVTFLSNKNNSDKNICYYIDRKVKLEKYSEENNYFSSKKIRSYLNLIPKIYFFISKIIKLRQVIKKNNPDVILGVMSYPSLICFIASIGLKTKVISTDHSSFDRPEEVKLKFKDYFFKFYINKIYTVVTVLTEADKIFIGNRLKNVVVMPNPLALSPIKEIKLDEKKKKILAVGRIDAWYYKGFDLLIKAWSRLASKYPDWILEIAGDYSSESKNELDKIITECSLNTRILFSGFHLSVEKIYKESEIFILSSRYEGFGMVLIEAMSQGCACIACDYKGRQSEIIRNDSEGLCIDVDNIDALSNAIDYVISNDEYRHLIQQNAPLRAADYDPINIYSKWISLFQKMGL